MVMARWLPSCIEITLYKHAFKEKKWKWSFEKLWVCFERLTVLSISCLLGGTSDDL